jgi:hypothetical protein
MSNQDPLIERRVTRILGDGNSYIYEVVRVNRTCYHPEHSPDNPWIEMVDINSSTSRCSGCLKTIAPELAS